MTEEFMKALYRELSDAAIAVLKKHGEEVENSTPAQIASCLVNAVNFTVSCVTLVPPEKVANLVYETAKFIKEETDRKVGK